MESEKIVNKLQTFLIYIRAGITAVISIGSKLRYTAVPTLNNALDIPHKGYVDSIITAPVGTTMNFVTGDFSGTADYSLDVSGAPWAQYFTAVPTIIIRETISAGVYDTREDMRIRYDSNADTISFNAGVAFDGDITIKP